jgi:hypothetical protein
MKKGILIREGWWKVKYQTDGIEEILKIFPDSYLLFLDQDENKEVEFQVVDEFTHPELYKDIGWGDGEKFAKLSGYPKL